MDTVIFVSFAVGFASFILQFCVDEIEAKCAFSWLSSSSLMLSFLLLFVYTKGSPRAIDVYRGKTTLQITYKDSVAVDSIVVFK